MSSNSKRRAVWPEDRISGLPEAILCHILSFISTRDAVKTSVLSYRWNKVWVSVPYLDLCDDSITITDWLNDANDSPRETVPNGYFEDCVDRVLFARGSSNIHRFCLECNVTDNFSRIEGWIRTAIMRNVVELILTFNVYTLIPIRCEFPKRLFMCTTLKALKFNLEPDFTIVTPTSDCFPSLKTLHVTFNYPDADSIGRLFSCCPVLEHLIIQGSFGPYQVLNFNISAPKLKILGISLHIDPPHNTFGDDDHGDENLSSGEEVFVNVNAPNLEKFHLKGNFLVSYSLNKGKSLHTAIIDLGELDGFEDLGHILDSGEPIHTLFQEIFDVQTLKVSGSILEDHHLPTFNNLKHLELHLQACCSWQSLTNFLNLSPNLEYLFFEKNIRCLMHPKAVDIWSPPESVPICLSSCLKTICIREFQGRPDEMELVAEYLLKHGEVLNNLRIHHCVHLRTEEETQLRKQVSVLPRGSKTCPIEWKCMALY